MDFHAQQILTIAFDESGDIVIELLHACSEVRPEKLTLLAFRFRFENDSDAAAFMLFAQWDRLFYFSGQAMKSLDVPKCKSICPQRLSPAASAHLSFAMSASLFPRCLRRS